MEDRSIINDAKNDDDSARVGSKVMLPKGNRTGRSKRAETLQSSLNIEDTSEISTIRNNASVLHVKVLSTSNIQGLMPEPSENSHRCVHDCDYITNYYL